MVHLNHFLHRIFLKCDTYYAGKIKTATQLLSTTLLLSYSPSSVFRPSVFDRGTEAYALSLFARTVCTHLHFYALIPINPNHGVVSKLKPQFIQFRCPAFFFKDSETSHVFCGLGDILHSKFSYSLLR